MKNIAAALLNAQTQMSNPKKDNENPFYRNKYADLNSVREA
ncbi:MAG: Essential recombination protein, partial [Petrotoga mobilis]